MITPYTHREPWLHSAITLFSAEIFKPAGYTVPENIKVSCGFPGGRKGKHQHAIGQCWASECSKSGHHEIFISPELDCRLRVSDVLIHELIHATVGIPAGHKTPFKRCAVKVGLEGKMTATTASTHLTERLNALLEDVGPYPHAMLAPTLTSGRKKQGTRLIKLQRDACGYTIRTTQKWLLVGLPMCQCGEVFEAPDLDGGSDE